jgi:hypothetical protein
MPVVYWLFDDRCICVMRHGYVGVSTRWANRLRRHKRGRFPTFCWKLLFDGSLADCLLFERQLRPMPGIGWNEAPGGEYGGGSAAKKERTKQLMREAALRRYAQPGERERTQASVKAAFKSIDRSGANNPRFGIAMSDETKAKISAKARDRGMRGARNPMFGKKRTDMKRDDRGRFFGRA